ncbi:hypothetical protein AAFN86_20830 [Roseomonas sp. CAU 1739]|uniref:hypothetical protein n=1 Tax=Roseomonas sp. CAU 1739 TaxID=3140364 RepID=UPI00325BD8E6
MPISSETLVGDVKVSIHRGSHPGYTSYVETALRIFELEFNNRVIEVSQDPNSTHAHAVETAVREMVAKIQAFQDHLRIGLNDAERMPLNRLSLYDEKYSDWTKEQKLQEVRDIWAQRTAELNQLLNGKEFTNRWNDIRGNDSNPPDQFREQIDRALAVDPDINNNTDPRTTLERIATVNSDVELGRAIVPEAFRPNWTTAQLAELGNHTRHIAHSMMPLAALEYAQVGSAVVDHLRNGDFASAGMELGRFAAE